MKSAVTISLVSEARGGPFVFWGDLGAGCRAAAEMGFDAVEVFPPSAEAIRESGLRSILQEHGLKLAAVGTGAGWVKHRLSLTSEDEAVRNRAREFVSEIVDAAGELGAPAIVGSMQGRWADGANRDTAEAWLREALGTLGVRAMDYHLPLLYEPLNRYETNFCNTLHAGAQMLQSLDSGFVRLLADLFHMNIEEADIARAIRECGDYIGHVHLADSNRRPAGQGHTDFVPIGRALRDIGYDGFVSAEALPYPDSDAAAKATIDTFNRCF